MKIIIWILSIINIYFGGRNFLNAIYVLKDSKYAQSTNVVFAIIFLSMGILGLYFALVKHNYKIALMIEVGPWILGILVILFMMMTGDYR